MNIAKSKITIVGTTLVLLGSVLLTAVAAADINTQVAQLDIGTSTLDDIIRIFGEPEKYLWGGETFTKDNLPRVYIAQYSDDFSVVMVTGKVDELRFESPEYLFHKKIRVGSSLDEVLEVVGQPTKAIEGGQNKFQDGVLYKDIDGEKGYCYYGRKDKGVRFFFLNYKVIALYLTRSNSEETSHSSKSVIDINAQVAQLDIDTVTLDDVIWIFGEPIKYSWAGQTFTKQNLPSLYCVVYPNRFLVVMNHGKVEELRHHKPGYIWQGKLQIGSSLKEVLEVVGQPTETIVGETLRGAAKDSVLYKDIDARKGYCYYSRADQNVRFFFTDYKVNAIYVTRSDSDAGRGGSFKTVRPINSVNQFDDVRWKDLSKLDLSGRPNLIARLTFNQKTVWPKPAKMPAGCNPDKIMTDALNPGLGIRELHQQGITGKGVNVAIIDQPLYLDHPEFAGKIVAYHDTGCGSESSMHGPAVASLLVGANCGTAPDARVYYAAAPSWKRDTAYEARALDWIIEQNEKLPASKKIRVVSVSAAPSSPNVRDKNRHMWGQACARAEAAGIIVLDCTGERGFIGPCWYNARFPDNVTQCTPGFLRIEDFRPDPDSILVPTYPRTTAEQYDKDEFSYQYCGRGGGLSWAIPYCAGVLALGWQIRPDLPAEQMKELLFESAYTKKDGAKIINPKKFIRLVRAAKSPRAKYRRSAGK